MRLLPAHATRAGASGLVSISFSGFRSTDGMGNCPEKGCNNETASFSSKLLENTVIQLKNYFRGELKTFNLPLDISGTDFQKKVWSKLMTVEYGNTLSYGEIAAKLGKPGAARAVGNACNKNPLPIIIPCHRILGASGRLTGYGGGLEAKKFLLKLERQG